MTSMLKPSTDLRALRVGLITTYPPSRCGIARYSSLLVDTLSTMRPAFEIDVVRLVSEKCSEIVNGESLMTIIPDLDISIRTAARRLNRCDVVLVQHEYGIFGKNDGESVLQLLDLLDTPVVSVLHTVPSAPTARQSEILRAIEKRSRIVALSESAKTGLVSTYGFDPSNIDVIQHPAPWRNAPIAAPPRRSILSWGLLGPGKGLERAIEAMSELKDIRPEPSYRIVGRTHPNVVQQSRYSYRNYLERLVINTGTTEMVRFNDRYIDDTELFDEVRRSDIVVLPYDNDEQVVSGVLADAIAAGRPVVATAFPHAEELLGDGAGIVVGHSSREIADAIRLLLTDDAKYESCARRASEISSSLSWEAAGDRYADILSHAVDRTLTPVLEFSEETRPVS